MYEKKYQGFGPTLFSEKLLELEGIEAARKSLIDIPTHYKQSSLLASSTIKELQKALGSPSVQSALPKLSELSFIQDSIKSFKDNRDIQSIIKLLLC